MLWRCWCLHGHMHTLLWSDPVQVNVTCMFLMWCYDPCCRTLMTQSLHNLIAGRPVELSPLQTSIGRSFRPTFLRPNFCTCHPVHKPNSSFCQFHLSASATLKCPIRFRYGKCKNAFLKVTVMNRSFPKLLERNNLIQRISQSSCIYAFQSSLFPPYTQFFNFVGVLDIVCCCKSCL